MSFHSQHAPPPIQGGGEYALLQLLERAGLLIHLEVDRQGKIIHIPDCFSAFFGADNWSERPTRLGQLLNPTELNHLLAVMARATGLRASQLSSTTLSLQSEGNVQAYPCDLVVGIYPGAQQSTPSTPFSNSSIHHAQQSEGTIVLYFINKTSWKGLAADEIQNHRLSSVGALAAGVAHDLNNLFTGALTFTSLIAPKLTDTKDKGHLHLVEKTIDRASHLSRGILDFLREDQTTVSAIDPLGCIRDISQMVMRTLPQGINVDVSLPAKKFPVNMKRGELCQIVLNLLINARDACGEQGEIQIRGFYQPEQEPTSFVLKVTDSGSGIANESLDKIFEPFFTTKGKNNGTGLGLAVVKKLIHERSGRICVESIPGERTCFTVILPVGKRVLPEPQPVPAIDHKGGTVWISELCPNGDSPLSYLLAEKGYDVVKLATPDIENEARPDLLVIDMMTDYATTQQWCHIVRRKHPGLKIIICSSIIPDDSWVSDPNTKILLTPIRPTDFWRAIGSLLQL